MTHWLPHLVNKKILSILAVFCFGNILLFYTYIPIIHGYTTTHENKIYLGLHQLPLDYYLYLTAINVGRNGSILFEQRYSTENTKAGLFYTYYVFLGHVGRILNISNDGMYHLGRIFAMEFLLLGSLSICIEVLGGTFGVIASIAALLLTIPPFFVFDTPYSFPIVPWWFGFNFLERLDALPHHAFGLAMLFFAFYCFCRHTKQQSNTPIFGSMLFLTLANITFPPTILFFGAIIPISIMMQAIRHSIEAKKITFPKQSKLAIQLFILSVICFGIIKLQESLGFPWNQWTLWELARWNLSEPLFDSTIYKIFNVQILIAVVVFVVSAYKKNLPMQISSTWALLSFALLPIATFVHIPKIRLFQLALYTPMAINTTYLFTCIRHKIRLIVLIFSCVYIISMAIIGVEQYTKKINSIYQDGEYGYIPSDVVNTLAFMNASLPKDANVLSYEYEGILIPAFTKQKVYWAQLNQTFNYWEKKETVIQFFENAMTDEEAKNFLNSNAIHYIYYGYHERTLSSQSLKYPFLVPINQNGSVTIFQVQQ